MALRISLSVHAKPYDGTPDQLVVPFAASHQPRALDTGQVGSSGQVDTDGRILVHLEVRSGKRIRNLILYRLLDNIGLVIA